MRIPKPFLIAALLLAGWLPSLAWGQVALTAGASPAVLLAYDYDVDSLSYYYPAYCTPVSASSVSVCTGPGRQERKKITTSGASTTVTSVNSDSPFNEVSVGDLLYISVPAQAGVTEKVTQYARRVTARASANSITVDSNVTLPTAGVGFTWWKLVDGSAAENGWFDVNQAISVNAVVDISQVSDTGGIDYQLQCRQSLPGGAHTNPYSFTAVNKTAASVSSAAWSLSGTGQGPWDQCRVGLKITTADDDVITITAATNDDIDFKEYVNSYTTTNANNDVDFTEDPGGVPKVCTVSMTNAAYTGAALATHLTTLMNAATCAPDNTYLVSYSTTTHKFTIARATGTKTVSLLWQTGANTATSAKTLMGYADLDDTAATSYVSDTATGESSELTATLDPGIYATGTEACVEVVAEMQAVAVASTIACSYSATTDKITLSATGITQLMVLWNSGTNNATSADTALGFGADNTGSLTYTGSAIGLNAANEVEKVTVSVGIFR